MVSHAICKTNTSRFSLYSLEGYFLQFVVKVYAFTFYAFMLPKPTKELNLLLSGGIKRICSSTDTYRGIPEYCVEWILIAEYDKLSLLGLDNALILLVAVVPMKSTSSAPLESYVAPS